MVKRLSSTDQNNTALVNVPTPVNDGDAANKKFVVDTLASQGGISGPASSTDNSIARFDGATGKIIQDSGITISDNNVDSYTIASEYALTIESGSGDNDSLALVTNSRSGIGIMATSEQPGTMVVIRASGGVDINDVIHLDGVITGQSLDLTDGESSSVSVMTDSLVASNGYVITAPEDLILDAGYDQPTRAVIIERDNLKTNSINERLEGAGVTIEGVTLKDGLVDGVDVSALGAGGGITRSISTITATSTIGSAPNTDYVVFINTANAVTMPTAVGNTNKYTIKNITTSDIFLFSTAGQTFDGGPLTLTPNTSVVLYSDNANWRIT